MSVADAELQEMPAVRRDNRIVSGRRNLVYIARVSVGEYDEASYAQSNLDELIDLFHDATDFTHLAVIVDRLTIESIPQLSSQKAREVSERLNVDTTIVPLDDSVADAVAAIPADVDAVIVSPLMRLDVAEMRSLAERLIERRLPSFSFLGRIELSYGLLMASGGREEDLVRNARRLALNVQRILLGDDPADMDIRIAEPQRLAINMQTAEAIGFYPRYAVLADAEELFGGDLAEGEPLALREAMLEAVEANLNLAVANYDPLLAAESRRLARAALLPQLGISARATQIDADRANPLFQAERTTDAQLSGNQVIYSDNAFAQSASPDCSRSRRNTITRRPCSIRCWPRPKAISAYCVPGHWSAYSVPISKSLAPTSSSRGCASRSDHRAAAMSFAGKARLPRTGRTWCWPKQNAAWRSPPSTRS